MAVLRALARTLRSRIEDLDPTELAYAQLWRDEELQPWSARAQAIWERESTGTDDADVWTVHHLAVLHHARAYDLESTAGVEVAFPHWEKALGHWAWLYGSDRFWTAMAQHLAETTGRDVPAELVAAARERLPADLLAVHTSLAIEHRLRDPDTARAHMDLVTRSTFPPEAIAAARHGLTSDLDNRVAQAVQRLRFGTAFDDVAAWLRVDPTNTQFLRNMLYVSNHWAEHLNKQDRWSATMGGLLDEVDALLKPALPQLGDEWGVLATEVARHEFWRGFWQADSVREALPDAAPGPDAAPEGLRADLGSLNTAAGHFRRALELDPTMVLVGYYNADRELAKVLTRMAALAARLEPRSGNASGAGPAAVESVRNEVQRGELSTAVAHFEVLVRRARNLRECADIEPLFVMIRPHVLDNMRLLRRLEDAMNELGRKKKRFQDSPWTEEQ